MDRFGKLLDPNIMRSSQEGKKLQVKNAPVVEVPPLRARKRSPENQILLKLEGALHLCLHQDLSKETHLLHFQLQPELIPIQLALYTNEETK